MLKQVKDMIEFICAAIYSLSLPFTLKEPIRIVICYHSMKKQDINGFEKQMTYLAKNNYKVVKVSEIMSTPANGRDVVVGISFDDAFVSVTENAVPILKKHGLPASVFVPVGNLGKLPRWDMPENFSEKNERVISEEQVAKLDNDGFEVLSHTLTHPLLTDIDQDSLRYELLESKKYLEKMVGHEILGIGYPHGAHDARVCNAAKRLGYKFGFTIEPHIIDDTTDDLKIGRFLVSPDDSLIKFKLKVSGAYGAARHLKAIKRMVLRRRN